MILLYNMKFLLIRTEDKEEWQNSKTKPYAFPPLGLLYIASAIETGGHTVEIIDFSMEEYTKEKLTHFIETYDAVGIHVHSYAYQSVAKIADQIRESDADIPIILGGPHCTFNQKKTLEDIPSADLCVIGEGELSIQDIIQSIEGKKNLSDATGIFYRKHHSIQSGAPVEMIKNLDSLPFPARHLVEKYDYKGSPAPIYRQKFTTMITSRGCPFNCRFCGTRYNKILPSYYYRERSVEDVVDEIEKISKQYNSVFIVDEHFLTNTKRIHKIMDKLIEAKTDIDLLILGTRVDSAEKKLFTKMRKAGVKYIGFGIESGSQKILDYYHKQITLDQIRKAIVLGKEAGFILHGSFILGAPIEEKKDIVTTMNFANSLSLDSVKFSVLAYQKGSDLWEDAVRDNKIQDHEYVVLADSDRGLGNFTTQELMKYCVSAQRKFYYNPSRLIKKFFTSSKETKMDLKQMQHNIRYFLKELRYPILREY